MRFSPGRIAAGAPSSFCYFARQHFARVDLDAFHVAGLEPLPDEISNERLGSRPPASVSPAPARFLRNSFTGQAEQFLIRHGGPQEVRKARSQRIFVNERIALSRAAAPRSPPRNRNRGEASTAAMA